MTFRVFPTPKASPESDRRQFGRREQHAQARREKRARRKKLAEIVALILASTVLAAFAVGAL